MGAILDTCAQACEDLAELAGDLPIMKALFASASGLFGGASQAVDNAVEKVSLKISSAKDFFKPMGSGREIQGFSPNVSSEQINGIERNGAGLSLAIEPPAPSMEQLLPEHALAQVHGISDYMAFGSLSFAMTMDQMDLGYGVQSMSLADLNSLNAPSTPAFALPQHQMGYSSGMMA